MLDKNIIYNFSIFYLKNKLDPKVMIFNSIDEMLYMIKVNELLFLTKNQHLFLT